ncbi:hypothetical protein EVAR_64167_1 [Eumeta japonica]|uniref:Uncharacterized protein n=1 Tax=Eumeta variegata TaxID=151549 RepID=A0A4C1ZU62_EUMVA|nr:hypothetical protein EVAR_64167_1 [Eumeta japonica]
MRNVDTDGPPACVLCKQAIRPTTLDARVLKETPSTEGRASRHLRSLGGIQAMLERRLDRVTPAAAKNSATSADDLSQLMSIITVIDTSELMILAKKFRAAANPTEKLLCLVEHASLVEAIKINYNNPI